MANPVNTLNDNSPLVIQNNGHPVSSYTIQSGQGTLAAGSVLAIDTDDSKLVLVNDADATIDEPEFVLLKEVDTTTDVTAYPSMLLASGIVNSDKLVFGGDDDIDDHYIALKGAGIIAVNPDSMEAYDNT